MSGPALLPKRFKGDAHAVVAMLFRPAFQQGSNGTEPVHQARAPDGELMDDLPLPVTILPKETCEEDAAVNPDPVEFAYDEQYWSKVQSLVAQSEVFFILRSTNPRDRWSGQVGFPGGRKKSGESDVGAAARETWEEVGFELPYLANADQARTNFAYIGRLNDRVITQNNRRLVVSCLMYYQTGEAALKYRLEPSEVAACGWVPAKHFWAEGCASAMRVGLQGSYLGTKHKVLSEIIRVMGVSSFVFIRIQLPLTEMHIPSTSSAPTPEEKERLLKSFNLWGLTLGLTSEMLVSAKLRTDPFQLKSRLFNVDRVFDSAVHNVLLSIVSSTIEKAYGQPLSWEQKITSYMAVVFAGLPLSFAGAYAIASRL